MIPQVGFEPTTQEFQRAKKVYVLDPTVIAISFCKMLSFVLYISNIA
jgi:hypothetical protein